MKNRLLQIAMASVIAFSAHQAIACKDYSSQGGDRQITFSNETLDADHANITFKQLAEGGRNGKQRITVHAGGISQCNLQRWNSQIEEVTDVDWADNCGDQTDILSGKKFPDGLTGTDTVYVIKGLTGKRCEIR